MRLVSPSAWILRTTPSVVTMAMPRECNECAARPGPLPAFGLGCRPARGGLRTTSGRLPLRRRRLLRGTCGGLRGRGRDARGLARRRLARGLRAAVAALRVVLEELLDRHVGGEALDHRHRQALGLAEPDAGLAHVEPLASPAELLAQPGRELGSRVSTNAVE